MEQSVNLDEQPGAATQEAFMRQLRQTFEKLPHDIPIYMFINKGGDDVFAQTNRQIVRAFREISPKITFREYYLDHELARKWNVDRSPTLLIAPERLNIRWLGAPLGEEGRTFLETLIFAGMVIRYQSCRRNQNSTDFMTRREHLLLHPVLKSGSAAVSMHFAER